jgi:2-haloacid dehalogenase
MTAPTVKALFFDVFGTCVDWRTGVAREGEALGRKLGLKRIDWLAFADAWRAQYQPQLDTVRSGKRPWAKLDILHRESLDHVLKDFGLDAVGAADRDELNLAWHRLPPWPDVVEGLTRLKRACIIAPVSNGHISLMVNLAKHTGMAWDVILGAEVAQGYKPQPHVYLKSAEAAGVAPAEAMMVAAHEYDLIAAASCGLKTALVPRPMEYGPGHVNHPPTGHPFDVTANDFIELAKALRA